jgi:hypothetical protein
MFDQGGGFRHTQKFRVDTRRIERRPIDVVESPMGHDAQDAGWIAAQIC